MGIGSIVVSMEKLTDSAKKYRDTLPNDNNYSIEELKKMMQQAALELDFERAAMLRDKILDLESS